MVTKILAPIDFSESSTIALEYAADLAARLSVPLVVLHAYEVPSFAFPEGSYIPSPEEAARIADAAQRSLDKATKPIADKGVQVTAKLRIGSAQSEIVATAEDLGCDLIVMGTHGRGFLSRALLGGVTNNVIRLASCPVLVIRHRDGEARLSGT